jgi:hypothetical protein
LRVAYVFLKTWCQRWLYMSWPLRRRQGRAGKTMGRGMCRTQCPPEGEGERAQRWCCGEEAAASQDEEADLMRENEGNEWGKKEEERRKRERDRDYVKVNRREMKENENKK